MPRAHLQHACLIMIPSLMCCSTDPLHVQVHHDLLSDLHTAQRHLASHQLHLPSAAPHCPDRAETRHHVRPFLVILVACT